MQRKAEYTTTPPLQPLEIIYCAKANAWCHISKLLQQDSPYITASSVTVSIFLIVCPRRMKPWWDPCSCLRTWCRTRRDDDNARIIRVCVCGCLSAVHLVSPPLPPLSGCGLDAARIPTQTWTKGLDWNAFSFSCGAFPQNTQSYSCDRPGSEHGALNLNLNPAPHLKSAIVRPVELLFVAKTCSFMPNYNRMLLQEGLIYLQTFDHQTIWLNRIDLMHRASCSYCVE